MPDPCINTILLKLTFLFSHYNTLGVIEMKRLLEFLDLLEKKNLYYKLNKVRDAIMIEIAIPGQRWEIEFFDDGRIEVEKFISEGVLHDESAFDTLFADIDRF